MSTKASKNKKIFKDFNYSSISDHQKLGKKIVAPLNQLPRTEKSSWLDDAAAEMLWAYIITDTLPREDYLDCFRSIAYWVAQNFARFEDKQAIPKAVNSAAPPHLSCEIGMTALAALSNEQFDAFAAELYKWPNCVGALGAIGLLSSVPGNEHWSRCFPPVAEHWSIIATAIAPAVDHQSEVTTDIRWLKILPKILNGRIQFPEGKKEGVKNIINFPNDGDLRAVRPSIRSIEQAMRAMAMPEKWIPEFWDEAFRNTLCLYSSEIGAKAYPPNFKLEDIVELRKQIYQGFFATNVNTAIDSRHDGAFGIMLYALSVAEEICSPEVSTSILARSGLRTLAELHISFSYLAAKDEKELWYEYRNFGNGQTKLAFLKSELGDGDPPPYVNQESLFLMANEDSWQEFVDVNTGHWANKNLRSLAIEGGTKDIYDKYYDWTSTYSHGHWGAIRDSNFATCFNPLHRFHRIPRKSYRDLPSVISDAISLLNSMSELLVRLYPDLGNLPALKFQD